MPFLFDELDDMGGEWRTVLVYGFVETDSSTVSRNVYVLDGC